MSATESETEGYNFMDEFAEAMPSNMSGMVTFLTAMWLSSAGAANVLDMLMKGATKEAQAVVDPVGKTIAAAGSSQCSNVKKIVGVTYTDYKDGDEPDMTKLTLLYINRDQNLTFNLSEAGTLIPQSGIFSPNLPFIIFLHGFTDDPSQDSFNNISNAFLAKGYSNILALDASSLIRWLYLRSSTMVHFIGEVLAKVLAALVDAGLDRRNIHLVGHSLGSHIAGFAGKTFKGLTGTTIERISGLDPAGPCFSDVNETLRLNKDDANFVDVMHTDAGVYGMSEQLGHVDFYPNSGSEQPNCLFQTCSHSRTWQLFSESVVNPVAFVGVKCDSWEQFRNGECDYKDTAIMGYSCPRSARGKYYLQTSESAPYGRGVNGTKYVNNAGVVRNVLYALQG